MTIRTCEFGGNARHLHTAETLVERGVHGVEVFENDSAQNETTDVSTVYQACIAHRGTI